MCFGNASKNSFYGVGWFVRSISMWSISKLTAPAGSLTAHTLTQSTAPSRLGGCPNAGELKNYSLDQSPRVRELSGGDVVVLHVPRSSEVRVFPMRAMSYILAPLTRVRVSIGIVEDEGFGLLRTLSWPLYLQL